MTFRHKIDQIEINIKAIQKIINPIGGLEDFNPLAIKFIGDPNNRIQEDYLRYVKKLKKFYLKTKL